jgi:hypothetical protein
MGTNRTPDNVRGFIVPWRMDKSNYWATESNATQGTKRAGVPEAQTPTGLVLGARGLQSDTVDVKTIEGGHISEGAKFGWKYATDSNYYAHNVPNVLTGVDAVAKLSLAGQQYITRAAVTTDIGAVLCAVEYTRSTTNNVRVYKIDPDGTTTLSSIDTVAVSDLGGQLRHPTLITLANGNVLLLFYGVDTGSDTANIVVYQTTDGGATWDLISKRALQTPIDISTGTLGRISGAATASQVLLFMETIETTGNNRNLGYQYASVSQGAKFQYVGESQAIDTTYRMHQTNVVEYNGVFVVSFIRNEDTIGITQLTDAFDSIFNALVFTNVTEITGVDFATTVSSAITGGDKYMHMDRDGRIYIYARLLSNTVLACAYSDCMGIEAVEYGRTWYLMGTDQTQMQHAQVFEGGSCGDVANIATTFYNGQQLMLCQWLANGTNKYQYSVMALRFGMWATKTNPALVGFPTDAEYAHNTFDWAPCDLPTQGGQWALTQSPLNPTILLDADRLDTTAAANRYYEYRRTIADKSQGATMHVALDGVTGGGASQGVYIGIQIQTPASSTIGYHVRVYIGPTALYLYDMVGNQLDSVTGLTLDGYALYLHVDNTDGTTTLYYANINGPRQYGVLSGRAQTIGVTTNQYAWGTTATTIGTTSNWAYVSVSEGNEMGIGLNATPTNGKLYPGMGFYAGLDAGLYITTQDGPARETDQWEITPQYDTPTERVLFPLYPSRGVSWRSDAVDNPATTLVPTNELAWALDPDNLGVDVRARNSVVGIHLNNINFRNFRIWRYESSAWVLHATVSNQVGNEFQYTRLGNTVRITDTTTDRPFLHYNECAGWYLVMVDDEDNEYMRKIVTNSEGVLDNTSQTKTVVFTIEDAQPTDPTSGGECYLVPNACTVLLHGITDVAGFRIQIPTQHTQTGYFEIGHMVMGPVVIPATQYGRGRTINWEANTDTTTGPNGVQYAKSLGNGGRTVRIAWVDGVDISELYQYTPSPDYYTTKPGGLPEAAIGSAPTTMYGIVQQMQGANNAVVYLPTIDTTDTQTYDIINRYHDHVMVTLGDDIQIENVIGDESQNEVLRVGTVVMREVR